MARKKQQRFKQVHHSPYVFEAGFDDIKNKLDKHLSAYRSVILELACGRGEYTIGLAQKNQKSFYIGIDIQGERLWFGIQQIEELKLQNVRFVRAYIDHLEQYFSLGSVDEIWITFPDPQPRKPKAKKRLTHHRFLEKYTNILKSNGIVHLKTDNTHLFSWSLKELKKHGWDILQISNDIDSDAHELHEDVLEIQTQFEKKFRKKGVKICYIKAQKPIDKKGEKHYHKGDKN
jgi:tRNA (guanine-N7-)-methyltransferase